jgi:hypothetical protein
MRGPRASIGGLSALLALPALLLVAACSSGEDAAPPTTVATTAPPTTIGEPALLVAIDAEVPPVYELAWDRLRFAPFFGYDDDTDPDDPFWHLHTQDDEAFWFSLEMFTTGFGEAWEGETGTFDLGCGAELSGICLHLDPDGDGDAADDLNADFRATGTIRIDQLDEDGYDLTLSDVEFTDGSTLPGPTRLTGP